MAIQVRKGQGDVKLTREEFERRLRERFYDPLFQNVERQIAEIVEVAWKAYHEYHKSPRTRKAGPGFADPEFELPIEWLETRERIQQAEREQNDTTRAGRVLLVCGAARHDQTCPGEMSKTFRLASLAREEVEHAGLTCDFLDLSLLNAEYGRQILPCKACVSTAMPLCHWPCSCYPNHAMGQAHDWMNELYPRWVAAHGVMIVTPVYWYQAPSVLKLMIDRLVCADGGNPDQTTTHGKKPEEAKALELNGWHYPRHLAGRVFAVVVHGDAVGAETLRRSLTRLADRHGARACRAAGRDRSLHRLLRALCDQPRRARRGHRGAGRGPRRGQERWSRPLRCRAPDDCRGADETDVVRSEATTAGGAYAAPSGLPSRRT